MSEGWIKLYRCFDDWEWINKPEMVSLFIHLLLFANHIEKKWNGETVLRGQLITGRKELSKKLGISEQTIRTCLERLESTNEIIIKSTNKYSIITICNYDTYQSNEKDNQPTTNQQLTNNQPTTNQQLTTTKNIKNNKNVKNEIIIPTENEFVSFILENCKECEIEAIKLKYRSWIANKWMDGNNKKIVNWKSKALNIITYLPKQNKLNNRVQSAKHDSDY